mgnify:CR=1 FL=1
MITGGHSFDEVLFFQMVGKLDAGGERKIDWSFMVHPNVESQLTVAYGSQFDVIVFYDMPGIIFTGNQEHPIDHFEPSEYFKKNFFELVEKGVGLVFLHHAIGGWPTWKEYGEMMGGKFDFLPHQLRDKHYPGSAYRFNVEQNMTVLMNDHPILKGFSESFLMKEEVYLYTSLEDEVVPLIRSDFDFSADNFKYGGKNFREHPRGSNLIAWIKSHGKSPIVYIQPGHGPKIFQDQEYRKLLYNGIDWAASDNARDWAKENLRRSES